MRRRTFLKSAAASAALLSTGASAQSKRPNIVFVFADQWRAQATGYAGDPNVKTPHIDRMASESLNLPNAVSGWPVCSPYRGTLMSGQYPDRHGVFVNDVMLSTESPCIAETLGDAGYHTGYIGKWHIDGQGRGSFIPEERRRGWQYWKVLECTHDYNNSFYYSDRNTKFRWEGYDVFSQTRDAVRYIHEHAKAPDPFCLFLSWGPPHNPYQTAPEKYLKMYDPETLELRPNVTEAQEAMARRDLAGYYAHCTAMDDALAMLRSGIEDAGIDDNTIFIFTSDHGDMLGSQGEQRKQRPWDESIRIPFLIRYPDGLGNKARTLDCMFNSVDIMPTLLGMCGVEIPDGVQGYDYTRVFTGDEDAPTDAALIACYSPFGEWTRQKGGREMRGVRTKRYTYIKDLNGPWLLYDNEVDPYQLHNRADDPAFAEVQAKLEATLSQKLAEANDEFLPGDEYIKRWGYTTDANGTVPYKV